MMTKFKFGLKLWIGVIGLLFVAVFFINQWFDNVLKDTEKKVERQNVVAPAPETKILKPVTRTTYLDPNRVYYENVFFMDEQEIARFKNSGEKRFDFTGEIPDGKVKFTNTFDGSFGEERYLNNERNGPFTEYYSGGELKREAKYRDGKVLSSKEYFIDGKVKLEQNFEDALISAENKEVGTGKAYYRDGTLMYEWNITNRTDLRYARSYNIKGKLVEEKQFDALGKLTKKESFSAE